MMKKVIIVLVCLLLVSACFALESGPSNKVGYVKKTCGIGYTPFGVPFTFWNVVTGVPVYGDTTVNVYMIVGTQTNCGSVATADKIIKQNNGATFGRYPSPSCPPAGTLYSNPANGGMSPGAAYFYQNKSGAVRYLVLAGEADTTAASVPAVSITAPIAPATAANTPYSWKEPRDVVRSKLNLLADGFTGGNPGITLSDRVLSQNASTFFYYATTATPAWGGTLAGVTAGDAYFIINKHVGHTWSYQYRASGAALMMPGGDNNAPAKTITAPDGKNTSSGTQKVVAPLSPTGRSTTTKVKK